jgi:hypothetical protein
MVRKAERSTGQHNDTSFRSHMFQRLLSILFLACLLPMGWPIAAAPAGNSTLLLALADEDEDDEDDEAEEISLRAPRKSLMEKGSPQFLGSARTPHGPSSPHRTSRGHRHRTHHSKAHKAKHHSAQPSSKKKHRKSAAPSKSAHRSSHRHR